MRLSPVDSDFIQNAVSKYLDMVLRIAYQNTQNYSDAEDVAQEVFIKLMKQQQFNDEGHMKAWLIRVTVNQCKDLKKSFWHRNTVAISEDLRSPDDTAKDIWAELRKLPKDQRNVIYLYYYEEYTVPEIAQIIGRKVNTVSSWLTRGRKRLKQILEKGDDVL